MPCFSHTLQLGAQVAMKLPAVARAIAHCKHLLNTNTMIKAKKLRTPTISTETNTKFHYPNSWYQIDQIFDYTFVCAL